MVFPREIFPRGLAASRPCRPAHSQACARQCAAPRPLFAVPHPQRRLSFGICRAQGLALDALVAQHSELWALIPSRLATFIFPADAKWILIRFNAQLQRNTVLWTIVDAVRGRRRARLSCSIRAAHGRSRVTDMMTMIPRESGHKNIATITW